MLLQLQHRMGLCWKWTPLGKFMFYDSNYINSSFQLPIPVIYKARKFSHTTATDKLGRWKQQKGFINYLKMISTLS